MYCVSVALANGSVGSGFQHDYDLCGEQVASALGATSSHVVSGGRCDGVLVDSAKSVFGL